MATSLKKGLFITFEGTEGSGKSTQSRMLYEFLKRKGFKAVHLREPGGTGLGEQIRKLLLSPDKRVSDFTEMLLYLACRSQLVEEKIYPCLKKKMVVICDRFADATVCYQGYGGGIDLKLIEKLNNLATKAIAPDITFFLDIGVERGLSRSLRAKGFADRMECKSHSFHRKVRRGYLTLVRKSPKRIKRISVEERTRDQIQQTIRRLVLDAVVRNQRPRKSH